MPHQAGEKGTRRPLSRWRVEGEGGAANPRRMRATGRVPKVEVTQSMHQPVSTPRFSIYYDYKVFPFQPPPELRGEQVRHPVTIVGAGPIGLVAALELARFGIPSVILTAERQVSEGSRALAYTRRSMEILQQVGVAERIARDGLPWQYGISFFRGEPVFHMDMGHDDDDRFFPATNLQQQYLEQYLIEQIEANPLVELRWASRVIGIDGHDDDGVTLRVDTPEGEYALRADWVIAADGPRYTLRQALGLRMVGDSYQGRFVIADIRVKLPFETRRRAYFDPSWNPGNTVLMHRAPHDIWRIDYQLPAGETPEQALSRESLFARINEQLAMVGQAGVEWELDWCSVYSAYAMTLTDYVHGRIIFAGDAAHMLPIFGVRGANTGFQDANNLGWKLALVHRGLAPRTLLDTYSHERVAAAQEIVDEAGKSTRFMTPPTRGFRLLRDAVLSLTLTQPFVRPLLHWRTSRPHDYVTSPLNTRGDDDAMFEAGPRKGAVLRNIRLGEDDFLFDHLPAGFLVLDFCEDPAVAPEVVDVVQRWRDRGLPLSIVAVRRQPGEVACADLTIAAGGTSMFDKYGANGLPAVYLVRPDQHVAARWRSVSGEGLDQALRTAMGAGSKEQCS